MNQPERSGMQPAQVLAFRDADDHPPVLLPDGVCPQRETRCT